MPIYDTSYRRIEGVRRPTRLRFLPIAGTGLRLFFRRRFYVFLALAAQLPFMIMLLGIAGPHMIDRAAKAELPEQWAAYLHLTPTGIFIFLAQWEWVFLFLFAMFAGAGLIANDLRANALEIYFSRPLTRRDYFLGKLLVVLYVLVGLTFLPCLVLWLVDVSLTETDGYWLTQLDLLPRALGASLAMAVPYAFLVLAISSVVRSARASIIVFAAVERLSAIAGYVLVGNLEEPRWGLVALDRNIQRVMDVVLQPNRGMVQSLSMGGNPVPLLDVPGWVPCAVLAGLCAVCGFIVMRRVRGVQVVAG